MRTVVVMGHQLHLAAEGAAVRGCTTATGVSISRAVTQMKIATVQKVKASVSRLTMQFSQKGKL